MLLLRAAALLAAPAAEPAGPLSTSTSDAAAFLATLLGPETTPAAFAGPEGEWERRPRHFARHAASPRANAGLLEPGGVEALVGRSVSAVCVAPPRPLVLLLLRCPTQAHAITLLLQGMGWWAARCRRGKTSPW